MIEIETNSNINIHEQVLPTEDAQAYFLHLLTILTEIIRFPQSDYLAKGTESEFKEIQEFISQLQELEKPLSAQVLLEKVATVQRWLNNQKFFITNQIKNCKNYEDNKRAITNTINDDIKGPITDIFIIRGNSYPYIPLMSFHDKQYKTVIFDFCDEFDLLHLELKTIYYNTLRVHHDNFKEKITMELDNLVNTSQKSLNSLSVNSKTPVYNTGKEVLEAIQCAYGRISKLIIEQSNAEQFGQPSPSRKFYNIRLIDTLTWVKNDVEICLKSLQPMAIKLKQKLQEKLKQELKKQLIQELQEKFNEVPNSQDANRSSSQKKDVYESNTTDISGYLSFFLRKLETITLSCATMFALNEILEEFFQSFREAEEFEKSVEYIPIVDMINWLKETYNMRYREYTEIKNYQEHTVIPLLVDLSKKTNELNQQFSKLEDECFINNATKAFKTQCLDLFKEVKKEIFDSLYDEKRCTLINKARVNSLIAIHLHLTQLFENAIYKSEDKAEVILQLVFVAVMRLAEYPQPQWRLLVGINEIVEKTLILINDIIIQNKKNLEALVQLNIHSQPLHPRSENLSPNPNLNLFT